jgi:hypothetical protein
VAGKLTVEIDDAWRATVSWSAGAGEVASTAGPFDFDPPLDRKALGDLRWYLEEYLQQPYGAYDNRGSRIEGLMRSWGEALFGSLLGSSPAARLYDDARGARQRPTEFVIRSASAARWLCCGS